MCHGARLRVVVEIKLVVGPACAHRGRCIFVSRIDDRVAELVNQVVT